MTLSSEQMAIRSMGIGSSEIAAVVGISPFQTIHDVWLVKRGLATFDGNTLTRMGQRLEDAIADEYIHLMRESGVEVETAHFKTTYRHPREPWIVASPDRLISGRRRLLEVKNVGFRSMSSWGTDQDAIPPYYRCQVEWQMGVCDELSRLGMTGHVEPMDTHVVAWIGGCDLRVYHIQRNIPLWNGLVEKARKFWHENVLGNVAPDIDGSDGAKRMVHALFGESWKPLEPANDIESELAKALRVAREETERVKAAEKELETRLKAKIGSREGVMGEGWKATWKTQRDGKRPFKFTWKETGT